MDAMLRDKAEELAVGNTDCNFRSAV